MLNSFAYLLSDYRKRNGFCAVKLWIMDLEFKRFLYIITSFLKMRVFNYLHEESYFKKN